MGKQEKQTALLQQVADCMTQMLEDRGLQKSLPLASYRNAQRVHSEVRAALAQVQS